MSEKCIIDPSRDCLGLQKAEMLEKQVDEYRRQSRETHQQLYARIELLERTDSARKEQYDHILEKLDGLGEKMDSVSARVTELEKKPAKRWEKIFESVLAAIAIAVAAYFLGKFGLPM